jgi:hypothetical protein
MIGKSQNFFRSFINDHRSIKNSPIGTSKSILPSRWERLVQQQPFKRENYHVDRAEMTTQSAPFQGRNRTGFKIVFLNVTPV